MGMESSLHLFHSIFGSPVSQDVVHFVCVYSDIYKNIHCSMLLSQGWRSQMKTV